MTRTKLLKRIAFLVGAAVVLLIISFYTVLAFASNPGPFWRAMNGARVTVNGRAVPEAQLYRPDTRNIYWCNTIRHVRVPGYIYARDCDSEFCPCVGMGDHVKIEVEAQLSIEPTSIEFNSRDHERIRVSW